MKKVEENNLEPLSVRTYQSVSIMINLRRQYFRNVCESNVCKKCLYKNQFTLHHKFNFANELAFNDGISD